MRRSIWSPLLVTVLLWVVAATLPHTDLRHWHLPAPGASWLTPPSWPVPALREHRWVWAGFELALFSPASPPVALRRSPVPSAVSTARPWAAAPWWVARAESLWRPGLAWVCALLLAFAVAAGVLSLPRWRGRRRASLPHSVAALADRGVAHSLIARRAGLSRDAVRAMLTTPAAAGARRRA